ncbi:MAG: glycoside hydrolase family 43 protein [Ruminococcaceae bacterium]|nr:glycoside hydrolase family 43 protein [Oscillospiraceae bacterium]
MLTAHNPILKGFHPDPSICRVGQDYYIATSTFQWFPGVELYHSRDLIHWEQLPSPLTRVSQLDLRGNPNSGGVWAPCLSHSDGIFYLIYTNVKNFHGIYKDTHNYLVTATDIRGPWSEPVYLNSSGFDPSLFHDDDGRKWLVNMKWDPRYGNHPFDGILLQEYSSAEKRLIGQPVNIFKGTDVRVTEAPHLYKMNGYYYLMVAEGGTSYAHGIQMARAKSITGPYEADPLPLLTTRHDRDYPLQRAGHGCLVDTPDGDLYTVFLCGRPADGRCILGRETGIAQLAWSEDGWLRLKDGGILPPLTYTSKLPKAPANPIPEIDIFNQGTLPRHYKTLRLPFGERMGSLTARPGWLRLYGREAITSWNETTLVGRRLQAHRTETTVKMDFAPGDYQHMAGLAVMYDSYNFFYLHMTADDRGHRELRIIYRDNKDFFDPLNGGFVTIPDEGSVWLRARLEGTELRFLYATDGKNYTPIGGVLDCANLSDEHYAAMGHEGHTGTFVCMACQDLSGCVEGDVCYADFESMTCRTLMD